MEVTIEKMGKRIRFFEKAFLINLVLLILVHFVYYTCNDLVVQICCLTNYINADTVKLVFSLFFSNWILFTLIFTFIPVVVFNCLKNYECECEKKEAE
ncbi:MAG: hypothetical protein R3Y28_02675 [Candidatus Gastranaerophilales bacterium]